jgi:hypothetical protein
MPSTSMRVGICPPRLGLPSLIRRVHAMTSTCRLDLQMCTVSKHLVAVLI